MVNAFGIDTGALAQCEGVGGPERVTANRNDEASEYY